MKKIVIPAALLLLFISRRSGAQTVTILTDSLPAVETPESYFYKRTDAGLTAVSFKISANEGGTATVLMKYTSPATALSRPSVIKVKLANGQTVVCRLNFVRKIINDNKALNDNLFQATLQPETVHQLQTLGIQSIVLLSAQQNVITEIPVADSGELRQHMLKLTVVKAN